MTNSHRVEEYSKKISEEEFDKIISENNLVIVDCFATWCGPCISFKPVFEELSKNYKKVKFISIDTDENPWISNKFDIDSIPRFYFFKKNHMVYEHKGASSKVIFEFFIKTKLLEQKLLEELEGLNEDEYNELIKNHSKVLIEFHPFDHAESEELKPFYIPIIEDYQDLKFLIVEFDNKKTKWARKTFDIKGNKEFPHFVMLKNEKITLNKHIHHPDALKYAIEENLYGRTPFTHDSFMAEEKFDTIINAYEHAIVFIMKEGSNSSSTMRNYLYHIHELFPDLPLISLKLRENPWLEDKYQLEKGEFTRYDEKGKKLPYFVFYKNGELVHESGPLQPEKFEDIIKGKLLKLFSVDEYGHGITEKEFNTILNENPLVVLDIAAVWCMPCGEMKPIFRNLSRNFSNIKFISVDLDYTRWLGDKFDVHSIPSFLFFKNGEMVYKHIGFFEEDLFSAKIQEILT